MALTLEVIDGAGVIRELGTHMEVICRHCFRGGCSRWQCDNGRGGVTGPDSNIWCSEVMHLLLHVIWQAHGQNRLESDGGTSKGVWNEIGHCWRQWR
jgi:hypothetical protein